MKIRFKLSLVIVLIVNAACIFGDVVEKEQQTSNPPSNDPQTFLAEPTQTLSANHLKLYEEVQNRDLREYGNIGRPIIKTLTFNLATVWNEEDHEIAEILMQQGINPGMGVYDLHEQGIDGTGVTVAIIDQPMRLDHPEFNGKVKSYRVFGEEYMVDDYSMHGPAVTSLLVGDRIGSAPGAEVYYAAVPSWTSDAQHYVDALDWIIQENTLLPAGEKIRVVSVSAILSGIWSNFEMNQDAWDEAVLRAEDAGILVLDCTYEHGLTISCTQDLNHPDIVSLCIQNIHPDPASLHSRISIPNSRTIASEELINGSFQYTYRYSATGLSWTPPYLAGVLAMGWQMDPSLTNAEIVDLVFDSAYVRHNGELIINPSAFIKAVEQFDE